MKSIAYLSPYFDTFNVPNDGYQYYIIRDDWEMDVWGRLPRSVVKGYKKDPPDNPLPATAPNDIQIWHALSGPFQRLLFKLMHMQCRYLLPEERLLNCWEWMTRDGGAQFDGHSSVDNDNVQDPHLYEDVILGRNIGSKYGPIAQQNCWFSGNLVRKLREDGKGNIVIAAIDITGDPPNAEDVFGIPYLVGKLTNSCSTYRRTGWWDDPASIEPPKFLDWFGVPYMVIGEGGEALLPKAWARPVEPGTYSYYRR